MDNTSRNNEIIELRRNGATLNTIGLAFSLSNEQIRRITGNDMFVIKSCYKPRIRHIKESVFWENVDVETADKCWEWKRGKTHEGYGSIRWNKICKYSHRISFELINGPIPNGLHVCHKCDNPSCCNPYHLFLGTVADNMHDRDQKGRNNKGKKFIKSDCL